MEDMSRNFNSNSFERFSKEIEDNRINENKEAELLNLSRKMSEKKTALDEFIQPISVFPSEDNCIPTTTKATGAVPKKAFSYLSNQQDILNIKNKLVFKTKLNNSFPHSSQAVENNFNTQPLSHPRNVLRTSDSEASTPCTVDFSNERKRVSKETVGSRDAGKLKPEVFAFLDRSSMGNENSKPNIEMKPRLSNEKKQQLGCMPKSQTLKVLQSKQESLHDNNEQKDSIGVKKLPLSITGINRQADFKNSKPQLPLRPPPVYKYPPDLFTKPSTNTTHKEYKEVVRGCETSTSVRSDPIEIEVSSNAQLECVGVNKKTEKHSQKENRTVTSTSIDSRAFDLSTRLNPLLNASITPSSVLKSSESVSKDTESVRNNQLSSCDGKGPRTFLNQAIDESELIGDQSNVSQNLSEASISQPELSKRKKLIQAIGSQANIIQEQILAQKQVDSQLESMKFLHFSSQNTDDPSYLNDDLMRKIQNSMRPLELSMTTQADTPPLKVNGLEKEVNSNPCSLCTVPDIISVQNAMSRPSLPQKVRPPQRSVSCSSLVQSLKDLSFSIWNQSEKDKRHSEGSTPSHHTAKDHIKRPRRRTTPSIVTNIAEGVKEDETVKPEVTKEVHVQEDALDLSAEKKQLDSNPWYHDVNGRTGQIRLLTLDQDGAFLIRPSSRPTKEIHQTLCVQSGGRILNLHIRQKSNKEYALGQEKKGEKCFLSLNEMIRYHQEVPIEIRPMGRSFQQSEITRVCLRVTPPK